MSIEKQVVIDLIQITENDAIQVREATKIIEDGVELTKTYHRHIVLPGDDYSQEDAKVQAVCAVIHTPEVIAAYQAIVEAEQAKLLKGA